LNPEEALVKNPNPDSARQNEIPVWNVETWLFEDFEVGARSRSIWRTI
jgi:hypothetical protein